MLPPMKKKTILEPSLNVDPMMNDKAIFIFKQLENKHYKKDVTFDEFLHEFHLEEVD